MLARVAELADAHDSGSCWRQYGFKSLLSHHGSALVVVAESADAYV